MIVQLQAPDNGRGEPDIEKRVAHAAEVMGLTVSRETMAKMLVFLDQLQKWNKTYNLTAIRNFNDMLVNHLFDCMAIISELKRLSEGKAFVMLDVGSGAGLPGLIVASFFPQSKVICVDSVDKKVSFIRHASAKMGCSNVSAVHARVESMTTVSADFVISRAFASLLLFVQLANHHVRKQGYLLSMKAAQVKDDVSEFQATPSDWQVKDIRDLVVPESRAQRYLVVMQRKEHERD